MQDRDRVDPLVQALAIVGVANTFRGLRSLVGAIHATVYL